MEEKYNRRNKYYTHIEPKLEIIKGWRREGYNEKQISELLGVAYSTFKQHKQDHMDLMTALSTSKEHLINELKQTVYQIALSNQKKIYIRNPRTGKMELERIEEYYTSTQFNAAVTALHKLEPLAGWKESSTVHVEIKEEELKQSVDTLIETIKNSGDR